MRWFALGFLTLFVPLAGADSWSAPPMKWTSPHANFALRRGDNYFKDLKLTLVDLRGSKPREVWTIKSPQTAAPIAVYFSKDGRSIVLEDEHHGLGYGVTLAFLGPKGQVNRTYRLGDLLPPAEESRAMRSISSIWWKGAGPSYIREHEGQFVMFSMKGTLRVFELSTGKALPLSSSELNRIRSEAAGPWRAKISAKDLETRRKAAWTLCSIRDKPSLEELIPLLDLKDTCNIAYDLEELFGDRLTPQIEKFALQARTKEDFDRWWFLLGTGPKAEAAVLRIKKARPDWVRTSARRDVLKQREMRQIIG